MGKLGMLHSNIHSFKEGASTRQDLNTSYSILHHFLVNTGWLGDLTQIWRNKEPPFHFQMKPISRRNKQSPWKLSFMLHLFYRPPYFCLGGILHILPTVPYNSLAFNRLPLGISPNLIRLSD